MKTTPTRERGRQPGSGNGYVRVNLTVTPAQRAWLYSHPNASEIARDVFAVCMRGEAEMKAMAKDKKGGGK